MNGKHVLRMLVLVTVVAWTVAAGRVSAETGGDQFLDGIGETALVARYVFNGNSDDWSRNNSHAAVKGSKSAYVKDSRFGSVLSLSGGASGGYVQIPGQVLMGADSVSVTGWVLLKDAAPGQRFFDFGQDNNRNFYCTPFGDSGAKGVSARITATGKDGLKSADAPRIATGKWVHLAVVLDGDKKTLSCYADGKRTARSAGADVALEKIFHQRKASYNLLTIGRSRYKHPDLKALIRDVRIYRIALSDKQVSVIRANALSGKKVTATNTKKPRQDKERTAAARRALPKASMLTGAADVSVTTAIGHLPRLPYRIAGVYRNGVKGPALRVIWPAPRDNILVRKAGSYTITGKVPGTEFQPKAVVTVAAQAQTGPTAKLLMAPFGLGDVILNKDVKDRQTQFIKNRDKFFIALAKTDPDSFLYNFRDAFGQKQPEGVKPLGGWDSQKTRLRGHGSGHYLSAVAQAYASATYDEKLRAGLMKKMDYLIDTLYTMSQLSGTPVKEGGPCISDPTKVPTGPGKKDYDSDLSKEGIRTDYWNWGRGFISGYPPDQFIMLEKGATYGGNNTQIWAPYYTLHKIIAGLLDCYEVGGNEKALKIAEGMGTWVYQRLKILPTKTRISMWNRYIAGEYGGMNEVMARLHTLTGKKKYLDGAKLFDNISFFFGDAEHSGGLARNIDTIRGKHANQHIPQITGALETYKGARDAKYYRVADNFWDICTHSYSYSIGGVAGAANPRNAECFTAQPNSLFENGFAKGGQCETCATYNMLKLSRQLFMFDPNGKFMDYYEQALYNHILASVAENSAANTYHVPLNPAARKHFGNPHMTGFTCCNGTAIESSTKLQDSIYFKSLDKSTLYVNLYVPSTVQWTDRKIAVTQSTNYPYGDTSTLKLTGAGEFTIKVRVPKWATRGFTVKINGAEQKIDAKPGTYLALKRTWKDTDTIELKMPFGFHLKPIMDQPNIASIFYGPVLLAVEETEARSEWRKVTLDADDIGKSITGDPSTLRFKIGGVSLKPFFETYGRHSVYVDVTLK
jgi:uncharacterized protein